MDTAMGVKGLIQRDQQVLILVKPDKELDLPGGRIEWGETPKEALIREIWEETGLTVWIQDPVFQWQFVNKAGRLINGVTYLCGYSRGRIQLSSEHSSCCWLSMHGMDYRNPGLNLYLSKEIANIRQPNIQGG